MDSTVANCKLKEVLMTKKKNVGMTKDNKLSFPMSKEMKDNIIYYETGLYQHKFTVGAQEALKTQLFLHRVYLLVSWEKFLVQTLMFIQTCLLFISVN